MIQRLYESALPDELITGLILLVATAVLGIAGFAIKSILKKSKRKKPGPKSPKGKPPPARSETNFGAPVENKGSIVTGNVGNLTTNIHIHTPAERGKAQGKLITVDSAPPASAHFTGRGAELASIRARVMEGGKQFALVGGMGGMGKSEICKKLFHEYMGADDEKIKHVGWIAWSETGGLKGTFAGKFRATANIENIDDSFSETKALINELGSELLLFIDNMNEISAGDKAELDSLACNIVASSRLGEIAGFHPVPVGKLSVEECVEIYRKNRDAGAAPDDGVISEIVKKAGCVTIVVELLARAANAAVSDSALLEKLNGKGFDLSDIPEAVSGEMTFNERMQALFDVSKVTPAELAALKMFSLFPPIPLRRDTAKKWLALENFNALNALAKKGWLTKTGEAFHLHDVISSVVRYNNAPAYDECAGLIDMLAEDLGYGITEIFTSRLGILPHGESVARHFWDDEKENVALLLSWVGWLYDEQGEYGKALEYYERALAIKEKTLGKEHPSTAVTYNNMAVVFRAQGEYGKALEYHERALAIREKALGKEHPHTATTYNNMALVFHDQGDYGKALEYYGRALAIRKKALGEEHPDTATTYNNMAEVFRAQDDYGKALEYHGRALAIQEKVLGEEHPSTASTYNNMAVVFHDQGDYDKALEYYGRALAIREKALGEEHPDTAVTYNNMAILLEEQGKYDEAFGLYLKALKARRARLPDGHPSTLKSYADLKDLYQKRNPAKTGADFESWLEKRLGGQ